MQSNNGLGMSVEAYLLGCTLRDIENGALSVKTMADYLESPYSDNLLCVLLFSALVAMGDD